MSNHTFDILFFYGNDAKFEYRENIFITFAKL